MYINLWYVAAYTEDLKDQPVKVRILNRDFVLFRDDQGKAVCLSNVSPHRGVSLSQGKVFEDGTIECPQHGWRFAGDGRCTLIPSQGNSWLENPIKDLPGAKVDSYPTHEEHGFIWAFLGDEPEAAPPIIDMPEIDQPGYRWVPHGEIWNANYHYCTFADIDLVHVPIVHAMAFNDDFTPVEEIRRPDEYTVESICRPAPDRPVGNWKDVREVGQNIESTLTFQISGFMLKGAVEMGGKGSGTFLTFYSASTPIDHETTYMRYLFGRNWLTDPKHDEETVNRNLKNVREDRAMAEGQMPKSGPLPPSGNDLVIEPEDYLMKGYWEIVERHSAKGWQIDTAALDQLNRPGERYHVIPSPGRKADPKNWVHPTVPTIDPSSFTKAAAE